MAAGRDAQGSSVSAPLYISEHITTVNNVKQFRNGGLIFGISANVVHQHLLGELGAGVGRAGPVAAYGYIYKDEEGVVEDPDA